MQYPKPSIVDPEADGPAHLPMSASSESTGLEPFVFSVCELMASVCVLGCSALHDCLAKGLTCSSSDDRDSGFVVGDGERAAVEVWRVGEGETPFFCLIHSC